MALRVLSWALDCDSLTTACRRPIAATFAGLRREPEQPIVSSLGNKEGSLSKIVLVGDRLHDIVAREALEQHDRSRLPAKRRVVNEPSWKIRAGLSSWRPIGRTEKRPVSSLGWNEIRIGRTIGRWRRH
jgi:hypothetical protein